MLDLKTKQNKTKSVLQRLIKISPRNSDKNVSNKMLEVSVLFVFFKVSIFIFCEEEHTRSFVCKNFQEINTVKIEYVRTVQRCAIS